MNNQTISFEDIFEQNKRRIHYHIHRLRIRDTHDEFFQEGLCALWNAYESYQPDKGPMATYFNFVIRNRLIDLIRKDARTIETAEIVATETASLHTDGNHKKGNDQQTAIVFPEDIELVDHSVWTTLKEQLTTNQWIWVYYAIIHQWSLKEIAEQEGTTIDAVKSWARQTKKKLRDSKFREKIDWNLDE